MQGVSQILKPISRQNYGRHMTSTITLESNKSDPRHKQGLIPPRNVSPSEVRIAKASIFKNSSFLSKGDNGGNRLHLPQGMQQIFHETHKSHGRQRQEEFKFMENFANSHEAGSSSPINSQSKKDPYRSPYGINFKSEASQGGGMQTLKRNDE
mmetsp:Transcript_22791/g.35089  ORF Transcript_22791/g.35089 Transcript_22791/m.35089 type:complete len:153 (+) Transcript_22791:792-1250(+)